VENLNRLLDKFKHDERTQKIIGQINKKSASRLLLTQMIGAQESFALMGVYSALGFNHIYIGIDKEEAAYIQNTLDNLNKELNVSFFPDSFKRPMHFEEIASHNILQRTESMNRFSLGLSKGEILVTYPEALFEKVVNPNLLNDQRIEIAKDESLDLDTIIEILVEFGFERVDFVYEPGQFAIRGGIVDIFSFGNEWPYRVELFDDEVESIRMFNPTTQLSIRSISKIAIIPNVTGQFGKEEKVNIFEVFPENTIIWIKDFDMLLDRIQMCFEKAEEFSKTLGLVEDERLKEIFRDRAFIYPKDILESASRYRLIFLKKPSIKLEFDLLINYQSKPQPSFNRKFTLLIEDLDEKEKLGFENYIFTDNSRQIERFYSIFEDLQAKVNFHPISKAISAGFIDPSLKIACYTDHQIFERFHRYKIRRGFTKDQAMSLKMLRELQPGDWVVHIDHGVGKYSGLEKMDINGHVQESVRLIYKNNDLLYVGINSLHKISKYIGKDCTPPKLDKIGSDTWKKLKSKTKKKVKDIAKELIKLYAKRKATPGFACEPDGYLQNELEASFMYEDTPDQFEASKATKEDMEREYPMDRLICGDVGFGKTEIAVRAAFKAAVNGKQVAILVPTTILAIQHYKTFKKRYDGFPIEVDYVNRFRTTAEKTQIFKKSQEGKLDVLIGTHAILNKKVGFKDLGLLVIDEEQKFGVAAKEKLRSLKVNVDTLTLTATPIPRTLQFSLMNARDLSIIKTPPPNRQPIYTERKVFSDEVIKESIYYEVNRGGQVFFVHNRVKSLMDITVMVRKMCPDISVQMAHGQMDPKVLERTLLDFIDGKFDVLISTNIIETGLDIPNANTMIINNAHQFGLSDLHQLRGRVGRSNTKAYCYLFAPPLSVLTPEARKRLQTVEEFSDLGSGFHIAMKDMDIRGAGNLLGAEQSGFISDIGYETYQRILEDAVVELKETEFQELFQEEMTKERKYVRDVEIDVDTEMLLPDNYVNSIQERLNLYTELDSLENEKELNEFKNKLVDRFGPLPTEADDLFQGILLRDMCKTFGFERLSLKRNKMRCFFIRNPQSPFFESEMFNKLMTYISTDGQKLGLTLKQTPAFLLMTREGVKNLKEAKILLERISEDIL
jgi:transcription-repair coupling factor (superfamily II helicase)